MAANPEPQLTFPRPVPDDFRITHPEDYATHGYPHQIWAATCAPRIRCPG